MNITRNLWFQLALLIAWIMTVHVGHAGYVVNASNPNPPGFTQESIPSGDRFIVMFQPGTDKSVRSRAARDAGVLVRANYGVIDAIAITVPNSRALAALQNNPLVVKVVPDHQFRLHAKATPPSEPSDLVNLGTTASSVTLGWTDNADNEAGFSIERCTGSTCNNFSEIATTGSGSTSYTDLSVASQTTYLYRVRAFISGGKPSDRYSGYTNTLEVTTDEGEPPPPNPVSSGNTRQTVPGGVRRVGVPVSGSDGSGIGVAVFDTGLDFNQPDLLPATDNPGITSFNAFDNAASAQDDHGHGTHVGGVIAALDNNIGVLGVAPAATLYAVKVADALGNGEDSHLIAGIDWIAENHDLVSPRIRVVNMSLGRPIQDGDIGGALHQAIQALYDRGIVVVASAGNDPLIETSQHVPSGFPEVLAVAGTVLESGGDDPFCAAFYPRVIADTAAYFTTDGAFIDGIGVTVSAPSEERIDPYSEPSLFGCLGLALHGIQSTRLILNPLSLDANSVIIARQIPAPQVSACPCEAVGTSFAAPHVSGVVARIMQLGLATATGDGAEVEEIRTLIRGMADRRDSTDQDPPGLDYAPLDQPITGSGYTYDGEREGVVQAPYPSP